MCIAASGFSRTHHPERVSDANKRTSKNRIFTAGTNSAGDYSNIKIDMVVGCPVRSFSETDKAWAEHDLLAC
jgi:hypothetical protein